MDRPTGTITFLFTDIEGSTKLWEQQPDAMKTALARHDALVRAAIEGQGGYIFKTVGDAFCAAFANAPDALAAALAAQRALLAETWAAEIGAIRIRAALHTGAVDARDGDYFGPPLNRVARLLAAGHGGQTLLSLATQELVRDNLPQKVGLTDLGDHRLRDLFRPERVYQLNAPDLPAKFPSLKTLDARLTNLPVQPTPFIGRERELAAVLALLRREDVRLVTLSGPGGTGKTRLSLQAAADLLDEYAHGVFWVDLAPIADPDLVLPTIAATLGVKESGGQSIESALKDYLKDKHLLLALDNFEQVIRAAPGIGELLAAAAQLKIIASSREKLRLRGEHEFSVPPLGLPNIKKKQTVAVLSQYEAVALFIQRAKAASDHWEITEANAPAVAEICIRLDGLPLAIELAAARSKMLTPEAMLVKLSDRLKALTGGARDLPARQQTLRGAIDWSYDLLDEDEKTLFARLGVFVGGWTLEAAEAVCSQGLLKEVVDGLESLLDKSLIRQVDSAAGQTRFAMLETIREYAAEKLEPRDDAEATRVAHSDFFVSLAEEFEPELKGPKQIGYLKRLDDDLDNLRAAGDRSSASSRPEAALRLGVALSRYWGARSLLNEGRARLEQAMEMGAGQPARLLARAYSELGSIAHWQTDLSAARDYTQKSLERYREIDDPRGLGWALNNMGIIHKVSNATAEAQAAYEECAAIAQAIGDKRLLSPALANLAGMEVADPNGNLAQGRAQLEEALELYREVGDPSNIAMLLALLGDSFYWEEDYETARSHYEHALATARQVEWPSGIRYGLNHLGTVALRRADFAAAGNLFEQAMNLAMEIDERPGMARQLPSFALLAAHQGQSRRAAILWGAAEAALESFEMARNAREQEEYDREVSAVRARMDEAEFAQVWAEGRSMPLEQAAAYALEPQDG